MEILKRDGTIVPFNKDKIFQAVNKAYKETYGKENSENSVFIARKIEHLAQEHEKIIQSVLDILSVEDIQNLVEEELMKIDSKVARNYIRYRYKKEVARNNIDTFMAAISEKLNATDVQNQNANVDEKSFGGRVGEASDLLNRKYALDYILSEKSRKNHLENRIYIHDLSSYAVGCHNCLTIPFDKLLAEGFNTRQTDVRPANSVNTAFQLVAVIFQLQSLQQFGK